MIYWFSRVLLIQLTLPQKREQRLRMPQFGRDGDVEGFVSKTTSILSSSFAVSVACCRLELDCADRDSDPQKAILMMGISHAICDAFCSVKVDCTTILYDAILREILRIAAVISAANAAASSSKALISSSRVTLPYYSPSRSCTVVLNLALDATAGCCIVMCLVGGR
jgi:hypothetical protein